MIRSAAAVLSVALLVSACASDPEDGLSDSADFVVVSEASLAPGDEIPAPEGDVVLTVSGDIERSNTEDGTAAFDFALLEQLQVVTYSVDDSQALGRRVAFEGVLLSDLLDLVGASPQATTLDAVALNDYSVEIPIEDATTTPVLVATRADGARMSVADYGPTRIIYPYETHELDPVVYDPRWIWQMDTVVVR